MSMLFRNEISASINQNIKYWLDIITLSVSGMYDSFYERARASTHILLGKGHPMRKL